MRHMQLTSVLLYTYLCKPAYAGIGTVWFWFDFVHYFADTGSATDVMSKQVNAVVREINVSSPLAHCYSEIIEAFGFRSTMFPFVEACQQFTRSQDVK